MILNLAIWFALHTLFREAHPVRTAGLHFDWPVRPSLDLPALLLAAAAIVAVFRFKAPTLWVLAGCAAAGLVYRLVAG